MSKNAPKNEGKKKPYAKPKLTLHGNLRAITATKGSNRRETGKPRTFNSGTF